MSVTMYGAMSRNSDGIGDLEQGEPALELLGEAEHEGRAQRADGVPPAEDQRGEGDEAAPGGHVLLEAARRSRGVKNVPAEAGDGAAEHHGDVARGG